MIWFLSLILGCSELGHDDFDQRDHASQQLSQTYPLSLPVAWKGFHSKDPEIKYRCKIYLNKHAKWVIPFDSLCQVDYSIFTSDKYPSDAAVASRYYDQHTFDGLCKAAELFGVYSPNKELFFIQHSEGIVAIVWARSKAKRLGLECSEENIIAIIQGTK